MILVGLSGSGKSTVARLVAELLGAPWVDLDEEVAREAGKSVAAIFAADGEAPFRRLEQAAMARVLGGAPAIIAAGGGWSAVPGNLQLAESQALTLYLCVTPEAAARRLGDASDRPLLSGDPLPRLREQLTAREPWYRRAGLEIDANGPADGVAAAVALIAKRYADW